MNEARSFSEYLKNLRKAHGYSQSFVAQELHISRQTYSHYETGRIFPPVAAIYALSQLYGEDIGAMIERSLPENTREGNRPERSSGIDDAEGYVDFLNRSDNSRKYKLLSVEEKRLLYYFHSLDERDKGDILSFLKIRKNS